MPLLVPSPSLRALLDEYSRYVPSQPEALNGRTQNSQESEPESSKLSFISHLDLYSFSQAIFTHQPEELENRIGSFRYDALVRQCTVWVPPKPEQKKTEKTPEYLELMRKLRAQQEAANMPNYMSAVLEAQADGESVQEISASASSAFNILFSSVMSGFTLFYFACQSTNTLPLHWGVLAALFTAIVVAVAEVVLYNSYLRRLEEREKMRVRHDKKRRNKGEKPLQVWEVGKEGIREVDPNGSRGTAVTTIATDDTRPGAGVGSDLKRRKVKAKER